VDGQEKESLKTLDLPIHLFNFLELSMPPAAKTLFEKRVLDSQKLLFKYIFFISYALSS